MRFRTTTSSRLVRLGAALALATTGVLVSPASPAAAVTPQCTQRVGHLPDSAAGGLWVPASPAGVRKCWMDQGNVSSGVWALQAALRYCYGQNIATDSQYGPQTAGALWRVQGMVGARQDGEYGPETAQKMKFSSVNTTAASACSWQTF
jgi:hypothetical protein